MDGLCNICGKDTCSHGATYHWCDKNGWHWRCLDCGETGDGVEPVHHYAVSMYEGHVVPDDYPDAGGFEVCKECYEKNLQKVGAN